MKKELDPAAFPTISKLNIVNDADTINEASPYFHLKNGFTYIVDPDTITTPFLIQPLGNVFNRNIKRGMDIFISTVFIITVLSWLIPVIALLIKLNSRGPAFFLQKRNKRNGELFTCIKFRSMYKNADADILPAGKNDGRITPLGRFLRNYYLDELPQFFNVLWGDMSIIGPRPHMVSENAKFDPLIKNYAYRHKVKPGITGLAQVMGYVGETDDIAKMKGRVNMDIFYVRHWSPKLDIAILYRTIGKSLGI
jgi:lipopolysaccharide/colanic/teichoic acid biosynthesis glycosyltransferase